MDRLVGHARQQIAAAEAAHERDSRALEIARSDYARARVSLIDPIGAATPGEGPRSRPPVRERLGEWLAGGGQQTRGVPDDRQRPGGRDLRHRIDRAAAGARTDRDRDRDRDRDQSMLIKRSREDYLALPVVVLAVGGDIGAFSIVLAHVFRGSASLVVMGTLGFAAVAVGLAHFVGQGLARHRCDDPRASLPLTTVAFATWLLLGASAFVTRLLTRPGSSASTGSNGSESISSGGFSGGSGGFGSHVSSPGGLGVPAVLPAVLFGALFLACGVAAIVATFVSFNPVAGGRRRAEKRMQDATAAERSSRGDLERALKALRQQQNERGREEHRWRAARHQATAEMRELQNFVRSLMASPRWARPGPTASWRPRPIYCSVRRRRRHRIVRPSHR